MIAFCISGGTLSDIENLNFENIPAVLPVSLIAALPTPEGESGAGDVLSAYTDIVNKN